MTDTSDDRIRSLKAAGLSDERIAVLWTAETGRAFTSYDIGARRAAAGIPSLRPKRQAGPGLFDGVERREPAG